MPLFVRIGVAALAAMGLLAQSPADLLGANRQAPDPLGAQAAAMPSAQPAAEALPRSLQAQAAGIQEDSPRSLVQQERLDQAIRAAKAQENGPLRFAADLFDTRQYGPSPTDGGISEDYVLGVGDRLQMNAYGSATFEAPLRVDGRGTVAIPKVGTVPVAGLSLAQARRMVQAKLAQVASRSTVDLSVTHLREVRVLILGEVYKPGSYLVPNLSSIINVLALAGGPTATGSFREIRVVRGGRVVHAVDLYPLRAEGLGNLNFGFQNGDTVFVPLVQNQVRMEGAFLRVAATVPERADENGLREDSDYQKELRRKIRRIEERLGLPAPFEEREPRSRQEREQQWEEGRLRFGANRQEAVLNDLRSRQNQAANTNQTYSESAQLAALGMAQASPNSGALGLARGTAELLLPAEREELEYSLEVLKGELRASRSGRGRSDRRVEERPAGSPAAEPAGHPEWLNRWLAENKAPVMLFELRPGETVQDAVRFAGGFAIQGFAAAVSLTRTGPDGSRNVLEVAGTAMATTPVERGDVLTALPQRSFLARAVKVAGWTRVQGTFTRAEGQRVGGLLRQHNLVLPDTYLERGELVHVAVDGTKRFVPFNLAKALAGDPADDLALEDRDEINLYRVGDLRLPRYLKVVGPVTRPGSYEFMEGMRASDLLFQAGVPLDKADRYVGELARTTGGQVSEVVRLDLTRLLSSEARSPVGLRDDAVNPVLRANDQISVFAKPDYKPRRSIILTGQVARPGVYDLDSPKASLRELIARAGGLTPEAMPKAGIFLRNIRPVDPDRKKASILAGVPDTSFTSSGVNDILSRLNETKRNAGTGALQPNPLLHAFQAGDINRLVVNFEGILAGEPAAEVELQDGDEVIIPRRTDVVYVVGETASPFAAFKVAPGMKAGDVVNLAGGYTRNADIRQVRLLKADGRIVDRWVSGKPVEPGDALLVPQRIRRDVNWSEQMAALTPLAILINTFK